MNASDAPRSLTHKAVAGASWSMLSIAARQILSFAGVAILARLLGPGAYGLMGMAATITTFLLNFRDLGTGAAVIQQPEVSPRMLSSLFWINLLFGCVLSLMVVTAAVPAAMFFRDDRVAPVLRVISISFVITSAGVVHQAMLSRAMAFHRIAWADLSASAAGYAVAIPCAFNGFGVWSLVAANIVNSLVSTLLYWVYCPWRPSWEFSVEALRPVWRFSLNLSGFGIVNFFSRNADNLIIGRVLGAVQLGYYQMAYNLMLYPLQNISSVIAQVLFPAFAKVQSDNERFRSAYTRSCLLIALVTFPIMAGMGVVADPLLRAFLGSKWIPSVAVFQILAPVGLVQTVFTTVGLIYTAKGRTDWLFRWGIYSCVVLISAFLAGVRFGIAGVASAYGISYLTLIVYAGFAIPFRLIGLRFRDFARPFLPQLAITFAMAAACLLWLQFLAAVQVQNSWARLVSTVLLGVLLYGLGMVLVYPPGFRYLVDEILGKSPIPLLKAAGQAAKRGHRLTWRKAGRSGA